MAGVFTGDLVLISRLRTVTLGYRYDSDMFPILAKVDEVENVIIDTEAIKLQIATIQIPAAESKMAVTVTLTANHNSHCSKGIS